MAAFSGIVNEKLTEDNYENWKECMKSYLIGQGLWDIVTGKEPKPRANTPCYNSWMKKNAMALHAIQISCEKATISKLGGSELANYEWERLGEKLPPPAPVGPGLLEEEETSNIFRYKKLYKAVSKGDWRATKILLQSECNALSTKITSNGDTALHVAVLSGKFEIVKKLVEQMPAAELELQNDMGYTAFAIAAINKFKNMVEVMFLKNPNLVRLKTHSGLIPVVVASLYGSKEMVLELYHMTPIEMLDPRNDDRSGATLLNCLITDGLFHIALDLLNKYPSLGVTEDLNRNFAIRLLAHKPSAFQSSGKKFGFWKRLIYSCVSVKQHWIPSIYDDEPADEENIVPSRQVSNILGKALYKLRGIAWNLLIRFAPFIRHIHETKLKHVEALELLRCIFKEIQKLGNNQLERIELDKALYDAIKHGIVEFVDEIIEYNPDIIWRKDSKGRTIFAHAITQRQEKIFSHVYGLGPKMPIAILRHDKFGNNFLHLAAKLSPPSRLERISGPALQMQRELQWFKEVKSMLPAKYKEDRNENNKTPKSLFIEEHQDLVKKGETWMKNTAASCMVVATLIAAVMFTSAFTVPGGNNEKTGIPIFLNTDAFLVFIISNALSLFSSSTSVLVFLGILTSRYSEKDFLKDLPTKLVAGLFSLFFSIVTMMLAFGSAIFLVLHERLNWVSIPVILLSTIPVALFAVFQFPLLVETVIATYYHGIFGKHKKRQY